MVIEAIAKIATTVNWLRRKYRIDFDGRRSTVDTAVEDEYRYTTVEFVNSQTVTSA